NVNLALQKLDTSLFSVFLPKDIDWHGQINGKAIVGWQRGKPPTINTTLYSDNGKIGLIQDGDAAPVTIPYERISLIALSVPEGLKLRADVNTGNGARGYSEAIVDPYKAPKPISGALVLNEFNLAILKPFFPGMRVLEGNITMAGGIGGTLTKPQFYGDVKLANGRVAMLDLPVNLSKINATAKIRGTEAAIDGKFNSGTGTGTLIGTINWQQELQAKLSIVGERLVLTQPPLLLAEVNPDIDIIVRPGDRYVNI
ncbi:translocation/assembly module TamB domain-containing protein, partial [Psychrobacter sp. 1U2]|uniref:translocation/assembly module TamB domain-containing protein n=1 Tax=Psychrobacter sp. 1U2 TaxID=3453577 RepID=UPI003F464FB5